MPVDWQTAQIGAPGDPHVFKVAAQRFPKNIWLRWISRGIAWIGSRHGTEQKRDIFNRPRHRSFDRGSEKRHRRRRGRNEPDGRTQSDDSVEVGWISQRAAEIAASCKRE